MDYHSQPVPSRMPRRARPSLAVFADSGYQPSSGASLPRSSYPANISEESGSTDTFDVDLASQLLGQDVVIDMKSSSRGLKGYNTVKTMRAFAFYDGQGADANSSGNTFSKSFSGSSAYPRGTLSKSGTISSAWSGVSNRLFMESLRAAGDDRHANQFTEQFDKLAKKHGIQPFPHDFKGEPSSVSVSSASRQPSSGESTPPTGNKFWNRILGRTPSTTDVSKHHGNIKMSLTKRRGGSISDLAAIGKGKRDLIKGMHLEDMIRLGGVAIFNLPLGLTPGDLLIPTCIHAAAAYILNNGLKTQGIFRVSGNLNTVFALYDHYQKQLEENNNEAVVATTALAKLPGHIRYSIHDVSHLFRKLLHGLPGGLLGSPAVFQALYNIHRFVYPDPSLDDKVTHRVKPRMIALAISSINLHFRIALLCAVFGLLRAINLASQQETTTKVKDPHELFTQMKEDALGIVFGPLLLGDKSEHILTDDAEDRGGLLVLPQVDPVLKGHKRGKARDKLDPTYNKKQLEKTRRAAMVCQMLIDNWEDICYQLKRINTLKATAQAYDLPANTRIDFKQASERPQEHHKASARRRSRENSKSRKGTMKSERSRLPSQEQMGSRIDSGTEYRVPEVHFTEQPLLTDDLMSFSRHVSEEDMLGEIFSKPVMERAEMTPIAEMTPNQLSPVQSMPSPGRDETPVDSPNWRIVNPSEFNTPRTPLTRVRYDVAYGRPPKMNELSPESAVRDDRRSPAISSNAPSPSLEVAAEVAIRQHRVSVGSSIVTKDEDRDEHYDEGPGIIPMSTPHPPFEIPEPGTFGRRAGSPLPEPSLPERDSSTEPEEELRPITPPPLRFGKKTRGNSFSIFEDDPDKIPLPRRPNSSPQRSPVLTLTKPNSRNEIRITPKGKQSSPSAPKLDSPIRTKATAARPPPGTPTRSDGVPLSPATPNRRPRDSLDADFEERYLFDETSPSKKRGGNTALYAEIRRLQRLVDQKVEETTSIKKELELAKNMANAGTLSHLVRETQSELKLWKNRAEWAERQLKERGIASPPRGLGHQPRYSMS